MYWDNQKETRKTGGRKKERGKDTNKRKASYRKLCANYEHGWTGTTTQWLSSCFLTCACVRMHNRQSSCSVCRDIVNLFVYGHQKPHFERNRPVYELYLQHKSGKCGFYVPHDWEGAGQDYVSAQNDESAQTIHIGFVWKMFTAVKTTVLLWDLEDSLYETFLSCTCGDLKYSSFSTAIVEIDLETSLDISNRNAVEIYGPV